MEEMTTKYEMTEQNKELFYKIADKIEQGFEEDSELGYYIECECVFEKGALTDYIASCIRQGYTIGIEPSWTLFIR